jgi:RimJ/RimL family protein N-acetyltransferase
MEAQHRWVRGAGFSVIETGTTPENAAMLRLNLRFGFTIIGNYVRDGQRVLLAKRLDSQSR